MQGYGDFVTAASRRSTHCNYWANPTGAVPTAYMGALVRWLSDTPVEWAWVQYWLAVIRRRWGSGWLVRSGKGCKLQSWRA